MVIRLCLLIERDDGLHDLRIVVPVLILQEVTSKLVDLNLTSSLSESNDSLDLSALDQALDTLERLISHGIDLGSQLEVSLFLDNLGNPHENLNPLLLLDNVLSSWWAQFHGHFLFESDCLLLCNSQSLVKVAQRDHNLNSLIELAILHQEVDALFEDFGVVSLLSTSRDVLDQISEVVLQSKVQSLLSVSTSGVKLNSFIMLALGLEVLS